MYKAQSLPKRDSLLILSLLKYLQGERQIRTPTPIIETQIKIKNISKTVSYQLALCIFLSRREICPYAKKGLLKMEVTHHSCGNDPDLLCVWSNL